MGLGLYLCRREVEVAKLLGPDHEDVGVVGLGRDPVDLDDGLSSGDVKVVGAEPHLAQDDVGGGVVAHVVQAVVDHHVFALHQVFVLDLFSREEKATTLHTICLIVALDLLSSTRGAWRCRSPSLRCC